VAGGVIGGLLGYWIGLKGGRKLVEKYGRYLFITPERFAKAEALFQKHGAKAIFFGRYLPAICVWGSNLSGIARFPFARFFIANFLGMLLWSTTQLTLGYVGGRSFETLVQLMNGFVILVVGGLVVGAILVYYYNRRRAQSRLQASRLMVRVDEDEAA
jgi:membrane protein DedA with SNARE-associated domain